MKPEKITMVVSAALTITFLLLEYNAGAEMSRLIPILTLMVFFLLLGVMIFFPKDYDHVGTVFVAMALIIFINVLMVYLELALVTQLMLFEVGIGILLLVNGIRLVKKKVYHPLLG